MPPTNFSRSVFVAILVGSLLAQTLPHTTYRASDGSFYDVLPLYKHGEWIVSLRGDSRLHYFAVARNASTCGTAACAVQEDVISSEGLISDMQWSEEDYAPLEGITIIYNGGNSNCANVTDHRFVIQLECHRSVQYNIVHFTSDCFEERVIIRSVFACPLHHEEANSPSSFHLSPEVLVLLLISSLLLCVSASVLWITLATSCSIPFKVALHCEI